MPHPFAFFLANGWESTTLNNPFIGSAANPWELAIRNVVHAWADFWGGWLQQVVLK